MNAIMHLVTITRSSNIRRTNKKWNEKHHTQLSKIEKFLDPFLGVVRDMAKCRLFLSRQGKFGDMFSCVSAHCCVAIFRH
jgi:hypothetical protein